MAVEGWKITFLQEQVHCLVIQLPVVRPEHEHLASNVIRLRREWVRVYVAVIITEEEAMNEEVG